MHSLVWDGLKSKHPDVLVGISKLDFSFYRVDYKCALVVAVPYVKRIRAEEYKEEEFETLIHQALKRSVKIINEVADSLKQNKIRYCIPAPTQTSEEELVALFSYKYAAANAGLGWIGKNDVLITEKYGPHVALYAILIDQDIPAGEPIRVSGCPAGCNLCIRACPYHALSGNLWSEDKKRAELIDYQLCNQKRSIYKQTHGRKHSCGICMVACQIGREG